MKRSVLVFVCLSTLTLGSVMAKGKPNKEDPDPKLDVVFRDSPTDRILSDGGIYSHGIDWVKASINIDATNDLLFDPDFDARKKDVKSGNTRYLSFELVSDDLQTVHIFSEGAFLNVDHLYGEVLEVPMGVGTTRWENAQFNTSMGFLRFNNEKYLGSGILRIEHPDTCTWVVTSEATNLSDGEGDVAVLIAYDRAETELGRFHVPFQMIVTDQDQDPSCAP